MRAKNKKAKQRSFRVLPSCQVYTPPALATAMVEALGNRSSDRWLEPCVGAGALLEALARKGVKPSQITGLDLDPKPQPLDRLAVVHRGSEFLQWARSTRRRFDKIIANPPYIAIERLQKPLRHAACRTKPVGDIQVTASGNTWYAFLCAAINLLRPSGHLCFLLPAAWDFSNYAAPLRANIAHHFNDVKIFRCATPLFHADRIQEGAVVLVAHGRRQGRAKSSHQGVAVLARSEFATATSLAAALRKHACRVRRPKASTGGERAIFKKIGTRKAKDTEKLGKLVSIHLGGVTGDSRFFLFSEDRRTELGLPVASLRPVLSRAKHLTSPAITAGIWGGLRKGGERIWLFDPPPSVMKHPAVKAYIAMGEKEGACNLGAHKIAIRVPWYRTPMPSQVDGFLSGMSKHGPWISFRQMARLSATNTLYVIRFLRCENDSERASLALALLTSRVADQLDRVARRYADGLIKFEPGDLRNIEVPLPSSRQGARGEYHRAVNALLAEQVDHARAIADQWYADD